MKRTKLLTLLGGICLVLILTVLPFMAACAAPAPAPAPTPTPTPTPTPLPPAEPYVIKTVSSFYGSSPGIRVLFMFQEKVEERSNGELMIQFLGGPEVIALLDQAMAVRKGVVDMSLSWTSTYAGLVPAVEVVTISGLSAEEERESGVVDLLRETHSGAGLYYLGRSRNAQPGGLFRIWTSKRVETPQDLAGMKIGQVGSAGSAFLRALGAAAPVLAVPDMYPALERGVIDGHTMGETLHRTLGLWELAKYRIDLGFYQDNTVYILNSDVWDWLPQHLQKIMQESLEDVQAEYLAYYIPVLEQEREEEKEMGGEFITFSPEDAEWYLETAYQAAWDDLLRKYPDIAPKFYELMVD